MSGRKRVYTVVQNTLCNYCKWAKDRVNTTRMNGCYCVHYGYIVSKKIENCRGYKAEGGMSNDGNDAGIDGKCS